MIHTDCSTIDIKAIAFDFDGTLLDPTKQITPKTIEAIEALKARGIALILATGRSYRAMKPLQVQLGIHSPSINYNGAAVFDGTTGKATHEVLLDEDVARRIIEYGRTYELALHGFRHEGLLYERTTPEIERYQSHIGFEGKVVDFDSYDSLELTKLMYISHDKETISLAAGKLAEEFGDRLQQCYSLPFYYEMMNGSVSKGTALSMLLDDLGVSPSEAMSFGDGHNDLPMLLLTEVGVAMANAEDEVRAKTRYAAPSNAEDGVARFLDGFFKLGIF